MSMAALPGGGDSSRTAACHNGSALWDITTLPEADAAAGIGLPTIVVNVIYTLVPGTIQAVMIASLLHGWFSQQNSGEKRDLLEERLRRYQQTLKYVIFGFLVYILDFQRLLFRGSRPTTSCLGNYAFPNFLSLWSSGLFVLRWLDLILCWSVPHLTSLPSSLTPRSPNGGAEDLDSSRRTTEEDHAISAYSKDELSQLGYSPIPMRDLVQQLSLLVVLLGPVPMSRMVLGDATYWQLLAGCVEGAVVAIAFHVCYMRLYQKKGVKMRGRLLALLLFGGGLRRELAALGAIGGETPSSDEERGLGTRLAKRAKRISHTAGEVMSRTTSYVKEGDWTEPLLQTGEDSPRRPIKEPTEWNRVSDLPGLEFLAVRSDTVQHRFEKQVVGLRTTNETLKSKNDMQDLELQGERQKLSELQLEKVEAEEKMKSLLKGKRDLEEERARLEEANRRTELDISNLRGDNERLQSDKRCLEEDREHLKEEGIKRQRSAERQIDKATSRYVEEQRKLVEIRDFAEALNDLQQARAQGDRARLKAAISIENMEKLAEPALQNGSAGVGFEDVEMLKHSLGGPLVKDARKTLAQWSVRVGNLREALSVARNNSESHSRDKMTHMAQRLFSAFLAAVDAGVSLQLAPEDIETCEGVKEWLNAWQSRFAVNNRQNPKCKEVQELIISKCIGLPKKELLGNFDFTDLETCLEIVDCSPAGEHQLFLERAREQVRKHGPEKFVTALGQLSQLTFFLEFLDKEDVTKASEKFMQALQGQEFGPLAARLVKEAVEGYAKSGGVMGPVARNEVERDPAGVVARMQSFHDDFIGQQLQDIFIELARSWLEEYGALAVPHHTQVVALLVFKLFLEQRGGTVQTLVAQVGTGEGKSMLIAVLAVYLVLARGMRVHVVGGDEKFTLRDYERFKPLFHWAYERFEPGSQNVQQDKPATPERFAVVCSKNAKPADDVVSSIPDQAWIVYCEARHVVSFYTQLARTRMDFSVYDNIVLLIDEVDALVVDSNPTSEIVYNVEARPIAPGQGDHVTIGQYTTSLGACILSHRSFQAHTPQGTADPRGPLFEQMQDLCSHVDEWKSRDQAERDAEYVRSTETDLYTRVEGGKLDPDFRSNFLECLRLSDQPMAYSMNWYERLFVVSKPRVFSKYRSILGFSATVGNVEERRFLTEAYRAEFLIVPPFLQTCVSETAVFHDAQWATTEATASSGSVVMHEPLPRPAVVEQDEERQREAVKELAFCARERVPVLIIAESPSRAEALVDALRQHVRLALAGADPSDIVRSLSQREYEQHAASYKANLHASTRPLTERGGADRRWRITVTDPTGGRGTDYQMTDEGANSMGGLMLVMMNIPTSERDWIQYKGRTARQKWRGQYCVVLDAQRQLGIQPGQGGDLLPGRLVQPDASHGAGRSKATSLIEARSAGLHRWRWVPEDPDQLVSAVLAFGSKESAERLNACKTVYKAGFLANEVCERVWSARKRMNERGSCELGLDGAHRETFVQVCEGYKYMTADEIDESAQTILGDGQALLASPHMRDYVPLEGGYGSKHQVKRIAFLMDVSYSMRSNTRPGQTRIGICKERMVGMLNNEQIVRTGDSVGILAFSSRWDVVVPLDEATPQHRKAVADLARSRTIDGLIDKLGGGTALFQSLLWGAEMLRKGAPDNTGLWLIVLTDGEDSTGTTPQRCKEFFEAAGGRVNLLAIAVAERCPGLDDLCSIVTHTGGIGLFVSTASPDSNSIEQAFQVVERAIRREQGGHQEAE